jgi:hypothetical protein
MKKIILNTSFATVAFFIVTFLFLSVYESFAQTKTIFPLKVGKTYHVDFLGTDGVFTIVTAPGINGWAVVNIGSGFRGANLHSSKAVGLNLNLAILIEELVDANSVKESQNNKSIDKNQSNKDAMINDLNNIAAGANIYRIRPTSSGGGGGSYTGYSIPSRMVSNENGKYLATPGVNSVSIVATSNVNPKNTISVIIDSDGRLSNWDFGGDFR